MRVCMYLVSLFLITTDCNAQYYRRYGDFFKEYKSSNQARTVFADTTNNRVYFIGEYRKTIGDSVTDILLEVDRDSIRPLFTLTGSYSTNLSSICRYHSKLFIGGSSTYYWTQKTNTLFLYNGLNWDTLSEEPNGYVTDMMVYRDRLYICGFFDKIGQISCNSVAYLDSSGWHNLDSGLCSPNRYDFNPLALVTYRDTIYMAGSFQDTCVPAIFQLSRFNGTYWESVPGWKVGNNSTISNLAVFRDKLYVAGHFLYSDGISLGNNIAFFDGSQWYSPGAGTNNDISSLTVANNKLFVGGDFTWAGGVTVTSFATWDEHQWCSVDSENITLTGSVRTDVLNDTLYLAGGGLDIIGNDTFYRHGYWVGKTSTFECGQIWNNVEYNDESEGVKLSPNPATGKIHLSTPINETTRIEILDITGRIYTPPYTQNEIDVFGLASGVYTLRLRNKDDLTIRRFIKE